MLEAKQFQINDGRIITLKDEEAREDIKNKPIDISYGLSLAIYIDAINGVDTNTGLNASQPIKTLNKAVELSKYLEYPQLSFYLMGDSVYEFDTTVLLINQACPHFFSYNGNPTLRFTYTGASSSGPRFYSGHVSLNGTENNRLKIDTAFKSMYFEGCSVTANYVDFEVPVRFIGGSLISNNCSFTSIPNKLMPWESQRSCLMIQECNARISDVTINTIETNTFGIYIWSSSVCHIYGSITTKELAASGNVALVRTDGGLIRFTAVPDMTEKTNTFSRVIDCHGSVMDTSIERYKIYNTLGILNDNSNILVGSNVIYNAGLESGETYTRGGSILNGFVTTSGTEVYFDIPLENRNIIGSNLQLTVTADNMRLYSNAGRKDVNNPTINVESYNTYKVRCKISLPSEAQIPSVNNSPVVMDLSSLKVAAI